MKEQKQKQRQKDERHTTPASFLAIAAGISMALTAGFLAVMLWISWASKYIVTGVEEPFGSLASQAIVLFVTSLVGALVWLHNQEQKGQAKSGTEAQMARDVADTDPLLPTTPRRPAPPPES